MFLTAIFVMFVFGMLMRMRMHGAVWMTVRVFVLDVLVRMHVRDALVLVLVSVVSAVMDCMLIEILFCLRLKSRTASRETAEIPRASPTFHSESSLQHRHFARGLRSSECLMKAAEGSRAHARENAEVVCRRDTAPYTKAEIARDSGKSA